MGADWDDAGLPRGWVQSNHKMKHCVENMVLMAFPPAAAQFTTITSAVFLPLQITASAVGSQVALPSQNCTSSEHPQQPQLALSWSAGSLMKMHLSIARHTLLCNSCWFCPTPSSVTILIVIFGRYLPWNLITPMIYHVYFLLLACNLLLSGCVPADDLCPRSVITLAEN